MVFQELEAPKLQKKRKGNAAEKRNFVLKAYA